MTANKAAGHSSKHVSSKKHESTSKHNPAAAKKPAASHAAHKVTTKAKHATHAKARGFAVGDLLPVCAFEAIAMSLRLAGQFVHDDDVAHLWWLAGADPDGATVGDALAAAARFGLAGASMPHAVECLAKPIRGEGAGQRRYDLDSRDHLPAGEREFGVFGADGLDVAPFAVEAQAFPPVEREAVLHRAVSEASDRGHALILGVDVPGPHCVLATPDGWWSWGELHDPWPARIEEAWAVRWL